MGKPVAGEIVILALPQTNLLSGKRRPALVVASPRGPDIILCQITSQSHKDQYTVSLVRADFDLGQLAVDSYVRINRLFTVEQSAVLYTAGKVKQLKMDEILSKLRALFSQ